MTKKKIHVGMDGVTHAMASVKPKSLKLKLETWFDDIIYHVGDKWDLLMQAYDKQIISHKELQKLIGPVLKNMDAHARVQCCLQLHDKQLLSDTQVRGIFGLK